MSNVGAVNGTINITMDQAAVTAALDAGQYVTLAQYLDSGGLPVAWISVAPAPSIVLSWTGSQILFVTATAPVAGAVIDPSEAQGTSASLGHEYSYASAVGFVESGDTTSNTVTIINSQGKKETFGMAQNIAVDGGESTLLATAAVAVAGNDTANFYIGNAFQLFLSTYESGTVLEAIPSNYCNIDFDDVSTTVFNVSYNDGSGKFVVVSSN